ncbi:MAG: CRISPR-associated endonuclease Cas3-HD [Archaeoglobaceae archaeon]|nr:CRISPR-associated endonuclease Cas3-HD [Archaeoglobaceae archaeon]
MIYARKSEEFEQSLEEHIEECLKSLEELKNTRFWRIVSKAELDLKVATIFHDSGKIFYQNNLKKGKLSFSGHEVFSAYILDRFIWHYGKFEKNLRISDLLSAAAVLYHHHAMGVKSRLGNLRKLELKFSKQEEFKKILAEHEEIMLKNLEFLGLEGVERALKCVNSDLEKFVVGGRVKSSKMIFEFEGLNKGLNKRIWDKFQKDANFRKMMVATTTALVVCDYRGAKGKKTEFSKVVDEFVELYRV